MKREEFMFTLGYQKKNAIVDKNSLFKYARLNFQQLLQKSLLKPALSGALFDHNEENLNAFIQFYEEKTGKKYTLSQIKKIFGVEDPPQDVKPIYV